MARQSIEGFDATKVFRGTPPEEFSTAMKVAALDPDSRAEFLAELGAKDVSDLLWDWRFWARPKQLEPMGCVDPVCGCGGLWRTWMILAGRGFGKTRTGAEWVRSKIEHGVYGRFNIVGATASDARDIMVEGPSGILAVCPPRMGARYSPTKRKIRFESSGAEILVFSADEPERLRGFQCEAAWTDELASWRYDRESWTQLMLGLRLGIEEGKTPKVLITTTPKPTRLIRELADRPSTHMTTGTTYENISNLADAFTGEIIQQYEGSRIGLQEIYARILDDAPGALWDRDGIDEKRIVDIPPLKRIVVAIDPAVTFDSEDANETGIIVAGIDGADRGYVLEDLSGKWHVDEWTRKAVRAYHRWDADRIIAEVNQGGDMVERVVRIMDPDISFQAVKATKGKFLRAEPISSLYEQGRVSHVGMFDELEDQMCTWTPGDDSPDRLDALVWAMTALFLERRRATELILIGGNDLGKANYWTGSGTSPPRH